MMYLSDKRDTECLLLLLFLCLLVEGVFAQQNQDVYLVDSFEIEAQSISRPVAYVFTDKDIYETGEAIWFNFFQVDGQYLTPFLSDRVLYLRLVHQVSREVVWEERYGLSGGKGTGHLVIKDGIIPGMYQLEAYTPSGVDKGMSQFYSFKELEIMQFIVPSMEVRCHLPATLDSRDLVRVTVLERFERLAGAELSLSFLDSTKKVVYGEQLITCTKGEVSVEFPSGPIAYLDILVK